MKKYSPLYFKAQSFDEAFVNDSVEGNNASEYVRVLPTSFRGTFVKL